MIAYVSDRDGYETVYASDPQSREPARTITCAPVGVGDEACDAARRRAGLPPRRTEVEARLPGAASVHFDPAGALLDRAVGRTPRGKGAA